MSEKTKFRIDGPGEYDTRGGRKAIVAGKRQDTLNHPWVGYIISDLSSCLWDDAGYIFSEGVEDWRDIVGKTPLITGPGVYVDRDGDLYCVGLVVDGIAYGRGFCRKSAWALNGGPISNDGFTLVRKLTDDEVKERWA